MLNVTVIGSGNVATHLITALSRAAGVNLKQVMARRPEALNGITDASFIVRDPAHLQDADIYIIAVNDNAVASVSGSLPFTGRLVVHTSGATPMQSLDSKNRRGVFYPLQTFSKSRSIDFSQVPLCLEAENAGDYALLEQLAGALSHTIHSVSSEQRKSLHVAAVFACNFANHMYTLGSMICNDKNLPFNILKPLIQETAAKIQELAPVQAQTGPAVRHDDKTISSHLDYLTDDNLKAVYILLTQSIQHIHGGEL